MFIQVALPVREAAEVGQVRRKALGLANTVGLGETDTGRVGIIVTEAARNIVQHGKGGEVILHALHSDAPLGIEVLALDKGEGIRDIPEALRDGYSTAGTPGTGLGAIRRLSDGFELYSHPGRGCALVARAYAKSRSAAAPFDAGVVSLPKPGEQTSGDGWTSRGEGDRQTYVVVDGLGHGMLATEAAAEAIRAFRGTAAQASPSDILEELHGALRKTRGAAVAVAQIDLRVKQLSYSGIGNISAAIIKGTATRSMVSHNGILGHEIRKLQEFVYPWSHDSVLIMHSDGLAAWTLDKYPGLLARHPSLVAGVLYRDFHRTRDDVTVLVAREHQAHR